MRRKTYVRFTPNSDRKSGFSQTAMSALPPIATAKADMCSAQAIVASRQWGAAAGGAHRCLKHLLLSLIVHSHLYRCRYLSNSRLTGMDESAGAFSGLPRELRNTMQPI
jgi:hypothetical protein